MRYASIDLLRTLAIFVMVVVHFGENLSGYTSPLVGFGAPLFAFLSGVSYCVWVHGQQRAGRSEAEISKVSVRRGLFVFGLGFAFNILVWLPEDTFNWDVLTFVGIALLVLNQVRRLPSSLALLMAVIAFLISPILRVEADYSAYWTNGYFECDLSLSEVLIGLLATGYFPFFPWIVFSLTGYVTARRLYCPSDSTDQETAARKIVRTGLLCGAGAVGALLLRTYLPAWWTQNVLLGWRMFPPSMEYVLGTLGMSLVLLGVTHRRLDHHPDLGRYAELLRTAKTFSRYSLTIYVVHHIVHLWPLWIYGQLTTGDPTKYWKTILPITVSLPLAGLFLGLCWLVLRRVGSERTYGIESWMRWLCD